MKADRFIWALGVSLLLLGACRDDSPVESGVVQMQGGSSHELSARQVQFLNSWLEEHRAGWSGLVLATPPPTTALSVAVQRRNGESGRITFYAQEGWKGALMYWGKDPGDNRQGSFAVQEVSALRDELQSQQ